MSGNLSAISVGISERNYFDELFVRASALMPIALAVESVAEAYLDGRPQALGKRKLTKRERDSLFWSSRAVVECPPIRGLQRPRCSRWRVTWGKSRSLPPDWCPGSLKPPPQPWC